MKRAADRQAAAAARVSARVDQSLQPNTNNQLTRNTNLVRWAWVEWGDVSRAGMNNKQKKKAKGQSVSPFETHSNVDS